MCVITYFICLCPKTADRSSSCQCSPKQNDFIEENLHIFYSTCVLVFVNVLVIEQWLVDPPGIIIHSMA
jgi:hypothetical protein